MNEMMRLLRKDMTRLRWLLALWLVVLIGRVAVIGAALPAGEDLRTASAFGQISGMLAMLEALLMGLMVARLVHEEPLVGMTAFWITRPYHRGTLLSEKLLFVLVVLVLLPLAADVASMAWFHTGVTAQLAAASSYLSGHLAFVLALLVLAVLTASVGGFVLTIVGTIAAVTMVVAVLISLSTLQRSGVNSYGTLAIDPDPTPQIVLFATFVLAALLVVVYQYRNRRPVIAGGLAIGALVAPLVVTSVWPWRFAHTPVPALGDWAERAEAHVDLASPIELSQSVYDVNRTQVRLLVAHVPITGMPPDRFVQLAGVRSRLTMSDGTVIRTERTGPSRRGSHRGIYGADMPVSALLGGARILNAPNYLYDAGDDTWPPIAALSEEQYLRYRGQTGRLDATFEFQIMGADIHTLPLRAGSAIRTGTSALEIRQAQPRLDGYSVGIRTWEAASLLTPGTYREDTFVLWNRDSGAALTQRGERAQGPFGVSIVRPGDAVLTALPFALSRAGIGVEVARGGNAFGVRDRIVEFPASESGAPGSVDRTWFDHAEFVSLDTRYAGILTRTVTVEAFPIPTVPTK